MSRSGRSLKEKFSYGEDRPERVFDKIWLGIEKVPMWDKLCDHLHAIMNNLTNIPYTLWLEAGSGTGRVSIKLSKDHGVRVLLLDTSVHAIKLSKKIARHLNVKRVHCIVGSIFNIPLKNGAVQVIWNAGVLEHFNVREQLKALKEFLRCLKPKGIVVIVVPNKHAIGYNIARIVSMKMGTWPFGYEEPLSHRDFQKLKFPPNIVFSTGFFFQFKIVYIPYLCAIVSRLTAMIHAFLKGFYDKIDMKVPGYFLVAVWLKGTKPVAPAKWKSRVNLAKQLEVVTPKARAHS